MKKQHCWFLKSKYNQTLVQYEHNDADKSRYGFEHEESDCAVRAVAIVTNTPYDLTYSTFEHFGRIKNEGTRNLHLYVRDYLPDYVIRQLHPSIFSWSFYLGSVEKFIKKHPIGRFLVQVEGHVFVIIDGLIHDMTQPDATQDVWSAWEITQEIKP